jgi:hypothetical protein
VPTSHKNVSLKGKLLMPTLIELNEGVYTILVKHFGLEYGIVFVPKFPK